MLRIGRSTDVHRLKSGESLRLGGIDIPSEFETIAHSDGDCLLHAISEAFLGALALGDLGTHFPDTDSTARGRDSRDILKTVLEWTSERGFSLVNLDATVHLERPKLAPHVYDLRDSIARLLGAEMEQISIKATTGESLYPVGSKEAIICECTLLLEKTKEVTPL